MSFNRKIRRSLYWALFLLATGFIANPAWPQTPTEKPKRVTEKTSSATTRPKLVVVIVVDQMRADYVDKFLGQWTGGLKRLVDQGAWFRTAAYPYAATETCPGHSTISTGAFPMNHGIVANAWWDRDAQAMVTCTADSNVTNTAYAGGTTKGGDSAVHLLLPAFAEELRFQQGGKVGVVALSLKARAAISLAGHFKPAPDAHETVIWFDSTTGSWVTSTAYGTTPFAEEFIKHHPVKDDFGKTWSLSLPQSRYLYSEDATGAGTLPGGNAKFPHPLRGNDANGAPGESFYNQWASSPFADTYLTKMAEAAVDSLALTNSGETDYLGISYSTTDYVGHTFGPRSWEIQDILIHLDKDLGELFAHLDQKVGRGNYVVAFTADHGVAPIPADMEKAGFDAHVLSIPELQARLEKALEPFHLGKTPIAHIAGNELYFSPGIYAQLHRDPAAAKALMDAALSTPGIAEVFRAEELGTGFKTASQTRNAAELSYFAARSGDLFVLQQPYWLMGGANPKPTGTSHGSPYYYDQRVPLFLMGFGIHPGEYFQSATPADIAPTLGALAGVTLAVRDGRVLSEALQLRTR